MKTNKTMVRAREHTESRGMYDRLLAQVAGPLLLAFGIFYFTYHVLSGERGVYALLKEERKLEVLQAELADVTASRKELDHRTRLMNAGSLDLDLLDEQSRSLLNNAGEDEMVIPLLPPAPSASGKLQPN